MVLSFEKRFPSYVILLGILLLAGCSSAPVSSPAPSDVKTSTASGQSFITVTYPLPGQEEELRYSDHFTITGTSALAVFRLQAKTCDGNHEFFTRVPRKGENLSYGYWEYLVSRADGTLCTSSGGTMNAFIISVIGMNNRPTKLHETIGKSQAVRVVSAFTQEQWQEQLRSAALLSVTYPRTPEEMSAVSGAVLFSITGRAGSGVRVIEVHSSCDDDTFRLSKFRPGDTAWAYHVDRRLGNLCTYNTYTVSAYSNDDASPEHLMKSEELVVQSDVGLAEMSQLAVMRRIDTYRKGVEKSVVTDKSLLHVLPADSEKRDFCGELSKNPSRPYFFTPVTSIGNGLAAAVRTIEPDDIRSFVSPWENDVSSADMKEVAAKKGTYVLAFYEEKRGRYAQRKDIPVVIGFDCDWVSNFSVAAPLPDRIIVDSAVGHESGPVVYIWDGKRWQEQYQFLDQFVPTLKKRTFWTPLALRLNGSRFSLQEIPYCCDGVSPKYPNKWSEFIFDLQTLQLIDVVLHDDVRR